MVAGVPVGCAGDGDRAGRARRCVGVRGRRDTSVSDLPKSAREWPAEPSAIEVVRVGRFEWQVYTRYPAGSLLGTQLEMPCLVRWTAERVARRMAAEYRKAGEAPRVASRIELGIERELLDGPS